MVVAALQQIYVKGRRRLEGLSKKNAVSFLSLLELLIPEAII
jgi:hypothetical protein